jgi:hypothetical protein
MVKWQSNVMQFGDWGTWQQYTKITKVGGL